ncbi:MAG: hypothetical protein WCY48_03985, partial [Candidatus Caldatribacteriota bacterium]
NPVSQDEIFAMNNTEKWKTSALNAEEFQNYILQHSQYYFSSLNNIFLFMLKDLASLSYFDKVFVRDGALSLGLFFLQNPSPRQLRTKLIIDFNLAYLVPTEWSENVLFSQFNLDELNPKSRNSLIITFHPDQLHTPKDIFREKIKSIQMKDSYQKIILLMTDPRAYEHQGFINPGVIEKTVILQEELKRPVISQELRSLSPLEISQADFIEINPYKFLFNDCFITWTLTYHGAQPLHLKREFNPLFKPMQSFKFSPYHSVLIGQPVKSSGVLLTQEELEIFTFDQNIPGDFMINLCSDGFKKYIFELAQEHADTYR